MFSRHQPTPSPEQRAFFDLRLIRTGMTSLEQAHKHRLFGPLLRARIKELARRAQNQ